MQKPNINQGEGYKVVRRALNALYLEVEASIVEDIDIKVTQALIEAEQRGRREERRKINSRQTKYVNQKVLKGKCEMCPSPVSSKNKRLCEKHRQHRIEYRREYYKNNLSSIQTEDK